MMRGVDPGGDMLLAQLDRMETQLNKSQREISSGLRVNTASDAPDSVSGILQIRAELARATQVSTNLARARTEVDTADSALQQAVQVLEKGITLGASGSGSLNDQQRSTVAEEVKGLQEQLVALSSTCVEGRYIFSGDQDQSPAYRVDLSSPSGVEQLFVPGPARQVEYPTGSSFAVALTSQEILDDRNPDETPSAKNAFAALNSLRVALENSDEDGINTAIDSLKQASAHVNAKLGFYGASQNRIEAGTKIAADQQVQLRAALGERQDADLTASILELQQVQLNQSAALTARGQIKTDNLFNYLR